MGVPSNAVMGGDPNGVLFKDWAWEEWRTKYGVKPPWGAREFTNLAAARSRFDDEALARAAWTVYLANTEPFYEGHGPGKFLFELGKWIAKAPRPAVAKKPETYPGAERAAKMVAILKEVEADDTIPATMKRDEMARRWRQL